MNIIKLLNKICAVNLSEPCRDDLKRLSDENKRLVEENEEFKTHIFAVHEKSISYGKHGMDMFAHTGLREKFNKLKEGK